MYVYYNIYTHSFALKYPLCRKLPRGLYSYVVVTVPPLFHFARQIVWYGLWSTPGFYSHKRGWSSIHYWDSYTHYVWFSNMVYIYIWSYIMYIWQCPVIHCVLTMAVINLHFVEHIWSLQSPNILVTGRFADLPRFRCLLQLLLQLESLSQGDLRPGGQRR